MEFQVHIPFVAHLGFSLRRWADAVGSDTGKRRYVAGAIGPLTVSLSVSPDADDPKAFPFGPAIVVSYWFVLLWSEPVTKWYGAFL